MPAQTETRCRQFTVQMTKLTNNKRSPTQTIIFDKLQQSWPLSALQLASFVGEFRITGSNLTEGRMDGDVVFFEIEKQRVKTGNILAWKRKTFQKVLL